MDKATLGAAWNGEEGKAHRAVLRVKSPMALAQLADHVRDRVEALK